MCIKNKLKSLKYKSRRFVSVILALVILLTLVPVMPTAQAETELFTVTFLNDNYTVYQVNTVRAGELVEKPEEPEPSSFCTEFVGWFDLEDDGFYDFTMPVTRNLTLHATFVENMIPAPLDRIVLFMDGDKVYDVKRVDYGETATAPEPPEKDGFEFDGWYSDEELTQKYDFNTPVTVGTTLYAKWRALGTYTIIATSGRGGSVSPAGNLEVTEGAQQTVTFTPDSGYVISDVKVDGVSVGAVSQYTFSNVSGSHTIHATFKLSYNPVDSFSDVKESDWFYDAVTYVTINSLFNGISKTKFAPNSEMTRAMFVTVLGRFAENMGEDTGGYTCNFQDVKSGEWYSQYVSWASAKGLVTGYDSKTFGTDDNITREQMMVLLVRFSDYMGITLKSGEAVTFKDADSISNWAKAAVERTSSAGLIKGYKDGSFRPRGTASRAEVATVFQRFSETYWV